jgi:hypothetical protein
MNINRTKLTEADYLEKIGYFIDKHIKSGNKTTPAISDLMSYVQKRISSHKDIGASKSKKVIQKGYDDTKLNELESKSKAEKSKFVDKLSTFIAKMIAPTLEDETLSDKEKKDKIGKDIRGEKWVDFLPADVQNDLDYSKYLYMESKRKVSNKDLKQLLEFIQEAEKSEKSKSEKEPESAKKPESVKKPESPKQEKNSEEEVVSPGKSVSSLLKSSGFSNFVQDASRMSSRRDKAEAYIQMLSALPSISDAFIRKAIINKFKTRE